MALCTSNLYFFSTSSLTLSKIPSFRSPMISNLRNKSAKYKLMISRHRKEGTMVFSSLNNNNETTPSTSSSPSPPPPSPSPLSLSSPSTLPTPFPSEEDGTVSNRLESQVPKNKNWAALYILVTSSITFAAVMYFFHINPSEVFQGIKEKIKDFVDNADFTDPLLPLYFSASYIISTLLFIPASFLTLAAGYIFGIAKGTAIVSVASTTGAGLGFLVARYLARPIVEKQLSKYNKFELIDKAISEEGWKIVVLWRLSPLFPFSLSNYMFGLTRIDFVSYFFCSWISMLPATFAYVYLGSAGRATVDAIISGNGNTEIEPIKVLIYGVGVISTLLVTREISVRASKALNLNDNE